MNKYTAFEYLIHYNTDKEKLEELHGQYQLIIDRLSELVEKEEITAFDKKKIVDITDDVVKELKEVDINEWEA